MKRLSESPDIAYGGVKFRQHSQIRMKKLLLIMVGLVSACSVFAGIYRHDVPPDKYKKLAQEKQFDCVGIALTDCGEHYHGACTYLGSCVLIGKKYVLSAAHLFTRKDIRLDTLYFDKNHKRTGKFTGYDKGGSMFIVNQPVAEWQDTATGNFAFRFKDRLYYPKRWQVYPSYLDSINAVPRVDFCGDLILIELEDTVAGVQPAIVNEAFDEQGVIITGVGYGCSGPADRPDDVGLFFEKIAGHNVVDTIEGYEVNGKHGLLSCDFDNPNGNGNRMGSAKPLPLEWSPGGGDCGGGWFRTVDGCWQLVGITTGGPQSGYDPARPPEGNIYGGIFSGVRTSVFGAWIRETIRGYKMQEMHVGSGKEKG